MDPVFALTLRVCFALLFGLAAFHKLRNVASFRYTLGLYEIVPASLVPSLALLVVGAEVYIAFRLPFSPTIHFGAAAVLAAYAVAIALNVVRGRTDLDCGCMGPAARTPLSWWLVARNTLMVALLLTLSISVTQRPLIWVDAVSVIGASAVLIACWLAAERMLMLAPRAAQVRSRT
jgi:hypothetical protein